MNMLMNIKLTSTINVIKNIVDEAHDPQPLGSPPDSCIS